MDGLIERLDRVEQMLRRIAEAQGIDLDLARDPEDELVDVARVYMSPAAGKHPTNAVMLALGYGSRATASRRVRAARDRGLIPPSG